MYVFAYLSFIMYLCFSFYNSQTIEDESLAYVCGFVVKKFYRKYTYLGRKQKKSKPLGVMDRHQE